MYILKENNTSYGKLNIYPYCFTPSNTKIYLCHSRKYSIIGHHIKGKLTFKQTILKHPKHFSLENHPF